MKYSKLFLIFIVSLLFLVVTACNGVDDEISISINPKTLQLAAGEEATLEVTVEGLDEYTLTWESSNAAVVTVNQGLVQAHSGGISTVVVRVDETDSFASVDITVISEDPPVETVVVNFVSLGETVLSIIHEVGALLTLPQEPVREGFIFEGWYLDPMYTVPFNHTQPIETEISVYAQWKAIPIENVTVVFDSKGGSDVLPQTVLLGDTIVEPDYPVKEDYDFMAWTLDSAGTQPFDFNQAIEGDLILYAQWLEIEVLPDIYTVLFDSLGGSLVNSQEVEEGLLIKQPTEPFKEGFDFGGWYLDEGHQEPFNFETPIIKSITLYAMWCEVVEPEPSMVTIDFDTDGGTMILSQTVLEGSVIVEPETPEYPGYIFEGWYIDASFSAPFNFSSTVSQSKTLYAMFIVAPQPDPGYALNINTMYKATSIQEVIDHENTLDGHTILVGEGDYAPFIADKALTIRSFIEHGAVIENNEIRFLKEPSNIFAILINHDDVTVDGFYITGFEYGIFVDQSEGNMRENIVIQNNYVFETNVGIHFGLYNRATPQSFLLSFSAVRISAPPQEGGSASILNNTVESAYSHGIYISIQYFNPNHHLPIYNLLLEPDYDLDSMVFSRFIITGNTVIDVENDGIFIMLHDYGVMGVDLVHVENNTVINNSSNMRNGIRVHSKDDTFVREVVIRDNTVAGVSNAGIFVKATDYSLGIHDVLVYRNDVSDSSDKGIEVNLEVSAESIHVISNTVYESYYGIRVMTGHHSSREENFDEILVDGNTIYDVDRYGVRVHARSSMTVHHNVQILNNVISDMDHMAIRYHVAYRSMSHYLLIDNNTVSNIVSSDSIGTCGMARPAIRVHVSYGATLEVAVASNNTITDSDAGFRFHTGHYYLDEEIGLINALTIINNHLENNMMYGIRLGACGSLKSVNDEDIPVVGNIDNVLIEDNTVINHEFAVYLHVGRNHSWSSTILLGDLTNITIVDNNFIGNDIAIYAFASGVIGHYSDDMYSGNIQGEILENTFTNNTENIVFDDDDEKGNIEFYIAGQER